MTANRTVDAKFPWAKHQCSARAWLQCAIPLRLQRCPAVAIYLTSRMSALTAIALLQVLTGDTTVANLLWETKVRVNVKTSPIYDQLQGER